MRDPDFDVDRWQAALAHQRPLLALAERLLGDPARAEDAVTHALLQESRGARAETTPALPFLRAVVRNFAWRMQRDDAVRHRHEAAARRADVAPAAVDLAAREQLRRRVAEAVLGLDEPYRTTVALVYLEEVPVAVAAAQLGIAEATVRVRLHRAREELRRRLDREFGSRGAWALVLGWGKPSMAAPVGVFGVIVGGIVMKKVLAVAVVAVLLLGGGSFALRNWSEPASLPTVAPAQVVAASVVSPPPAAAPVRETAPPEPIAPTPAAPVAPSQHFRCVDERGQPVANAEVRLLRPGTGLPDRVARSDAEGNAVVPELPAARYTIRAREGYRHFVPDYDPPLLPAAPRQLMLSELWIGGLVMPGVEVVKEVRVSYSGFQNTDHSAEVPPRIQRELVAEWQQKHPGASFWAFVRRPGYGAGDGIEVTLQWFGHQPHKRLVRMWPVSQFQGPEVVDPATVPSRDWVTCRIVLVDPAGQPLPAAVQAHLQSGHADLQERGTQLPSVFAYSFTFHGGIAKVPVGEYELRLFNGKGTFVPAARCTVARDTTELRIPVATADRALRLHLRGLPGAGYVVSIVHESGRSALELGRADGDHTLLLPPGPCMVTCRWSGPDDRQESRELAVTITDAAEQEVTWDLATPPGTR